MSEITDKKRGFVTPPGNLLSQVQSLSFNRRMREELGGLDITQLKRFFQDGETIIKGHGLYEKVIPTLKDEKKYSPITIYQPPSEIEYRDLAPKTLRYWNNVPTYSLTEVAASMAVCLPAPKRILSAAEARVFRMMGTKRKVFVFPGSDVDIFNYVIDQMGSIFELIPFSTQSLVGTSGILPTGELIGIPNTKRGWLRVQDKYAALAVAKDAFGRGLAFENIISIFPTFVYPRGNGGVYETGYVWDEGTIALTEAHYGGSAYGFQKNTIYPTAYSYDNWPGLSKEQVLAWLNSIISNMPYIKKSTSGYSLTTDSRGWVNFQDYALYDWISATMAYYTGDHILVSGFTPYWLTAGYDIDDDSYYSTKQLSSWWAYEEWGTTDVLHQYFYNMPQYFLYDDTYIPPIQG